jgi:hypothetical protein
VTGSDQSPGQDRVRIGAGLGLMIAAPVWAALALVLWSVASDAQGRTPFVYQTPRNVAEAAAMGTAAGVLRFLRTGADPALIEPVRPEIISSAVTHVTALEASIWSRDIALVRALDRETPIDGDARQYLACLGTALGTRDLVTYLAPDGVKDCDPAEVTRRIEARRP